MSPPPSLRNPNDFHVEEIPLYEPSGTGDHCVLRIEKSGISTPEAIHRIARAIGRREAEFGYAGLKDAAATARQILSISAEEPSRLAGLELPGVRVLQADRHGRKVRPGHLRGNRFRIRLGGLAPGRMQEIDDRLRGISARGMPNAYGAQRFGSGGATAMLGRAILRRDWDELVSTLLGREAEADSPRTAEARESARRGDYEAAVDAFPHALAPERAAARKLALGAEAEAAVRAIPRRFRQIYVSAFQSHLFNRLLETRLADIDRPWRGDLAYLHRNGACFLVEDPATEAPRVESLEISISGPIYGYKMKRPEGRAREMEDTVLSDERLDLEDFRIGGGLSQKGARRPLTVPLGEASLSEEGGVALLRFALPKGSYATTLLGLLDLPSG